MSENNTPVVRVTGPAGLLSVVAGMLGFHPTDSVVVVCINDNGRRVGPIMRIDVKDFGLDAAVYLADQAAAFGSGAAVLTYSADPVNEPVDTTALGAFLVDRGVRVVMAVAVDNEPQPVNPELAAANALGGRAILASRAAVAASIAYAPAAQLSQPVENLIYRAGVNDVRHLIAEFMRLTYDGQANAVPDFIAAVRQCPDHDPITPVLASVLGFLAYMTGDGALAQVAVDRAMTVHPGYPAARVLLSIMQAGVSPTELRQRFA